MGIEYKIDEQGRYAILQLGPECRLWNEDDAVDNFVKEVTSRKVKKVLVDYSKVRYDVLMTGGVSSLIHAYVIMQGKGIDIFNWNMTDAVKTHKVVSRTGDLVLAKDVGSLEDFLKKAKENP